MFLWGLRESRVFIADVRNVHDKPCRQDVLVLEKLIMSISNFGEKHTLWGLKRDDVLFCHLLNTTVTVLNKRNSTEANDLNQGEVFDLSAIVRF